MLDLPVDVVLPTHADPADRAALELAPSIWLRMGEEMAIDTRSGRNV